MTYMYTHLNSSAIQEHTNNTVHKSSNYQWCQDSGKESETGSKKDQRDPSDMPQAPGPQQQPKLRGHARVAQSL